MLTDVFILIITSDKSCLFFALLSRCNCISSLNQPTTDFDADDSFDFNTISIILIREKTKLEKITN